MLRICCRCLVYSPLGGAAILKDATTAVIASSVAPWVSRSFNLQFVCRCQMNTSWYGNAPRITGPLWGQTASGVLSSQSTISQYGAEMISLMSAWTQLANSQVTVGLRRYGAHGRIGTFKHFQILFFNENIVFWFKCHRNVFPMVQLTII